MSPSSSPSSRASFPLYISSLAFVDSDEPFLRLTAFNICLNALRSLSSLSSSECGRAAVEVASDPGNVARLVGPLAAGLARKTQRLRERVLNNWEERAEGGR